MQCIKQIKLNNYIKKLHVLFTMRHWVLGHQGHSAREAPLHKGSRFLSHWWSNSMSITSFRIRDSATAIFPCWVLVGVQDTIKKKHVFWGINPHTQHFLWRRIILAYLYTFRLMEGLFRILFTACDELPLLLLKKSHSDPQWTTIPRFPQTHCLSFLMTFSQPSISDMFQGWNIADLTAEAAE